MKRRVIIVFAKAPRAGSVKTRLARGIGIGPALSFYRHCLDRTIRAARAVRSAETVIWTAPDSAALGRYFADSIPVQPQGRGDLGQRMARALAAFPDADRVLIGGDIPGVTPLMLKAALDDLSRSDAVFGPAEDGGFWLVGLRRGRVPPGLFWGVRWSTPETLDQTLLSLPRHAAIAFAPTLNDIDDVCDYRRITGG